MRGSRVDLLDARPRSSTSARALGVGALARSLVRALMSSCTRTVRGLGPVPPGFAMAGEYALRACASLEQGERAVEALVVRSSATVRASTRSTRSTGAGEPALDGPGAAEHGRARARRGSRPDAGRDVSSRRWRSLPSSAPPLERSLPPAAVIAEPEQLRTYECDALTGHRAMPELVVLPEHGGAGAGGRARSATSTACRSSRAAPGPGSRAARCRSPTASSSRSRG